MTLAEKTKEGIGILSDNRAVPASAGGPAMGSRNPESRNLDFLRAIAVVSVFVAHLILTLTPSHHVYDTVHTPGVALLYGIGNVGVLLFFVHTSLVLMLSMERTQQAPLFLSFYIRRFFRIYPLSAACILTVLFLRIPYVPELAFAQPGWRAIVSNLLLVQNLTFSMDIISPLWTLPREVQMYVLLPVIFVMLRRFGSAQFVLALWLAAALAAPHAAVLTYVPCFLGGVFAYQLGRGKTGRLPARFWPVSLLAAVVFLLWFRQSILDDYRLDYVLCMIVGALIPNFADLASSWMTRVCHIVARYSYGIYLFHLPVIWFAFVKLRGHPVALQWFSLGALMCVVPWMAYTWLEAPLIETGRRLANRLRGGQSFAPLTAAPASAAPGRGQPST